MKFPSTSHRGTRLRFRPGVRGGAPGRQRQRRKRAMTVDGAPRRGRRHPRPRPRRRRRRRRSGSSGRGARAGGTSRRAFSRRGDCRRCCSATTSRRCWWGRWRSTSRRFSRSQISSRTSTSTEARRGCRPPACATAAACSPRGTSRRTRSSRCTRRPTSCPSAPIASEETPPCGAPNRSRRGPLFFWNVIPSRVPSATKYFVRYRAHEAPRLRCFSSCVHLSPRHRQSSTYHRCCTPRLYTVQYISCAPLRV